MLAPVGKSEFEDVAAHVGRLVRDARQRAGLTQEEAAHTADIDWRRWQRIEEGSVNVTVKTLVRVAAALKTDFWAMMVAPSSNKRR